jgi:hypothetical protein
MDTFDSIRCEEYYEAFGTEQAQFEQWVEAQEQEWVEEGNRRLRVLADRG